MVDEVLVMHDGTISERGSYEELLSHDGPFAQFLKTYLMEVADSEDEEFPECECYRSPSYRSPSRAGCLSIDRQEGWRWRCGLGQEGWKWRCSLGSRG